jgi:hypothetical protein
LHLIRDPRVWAQSVGRGGSPTAGVDGVEGVGVNQTFGCRIANRRESTPRLCSQADRGFVLKPQRQQKSCVSFSLL